MRLTQKIRRTVVYAAARFFNRAFNIIPRPMAVFIGSWIGLLAWKIISKDRQSIYRHLTICYDGNLSPQAKVNLGRSFFINSGKNIADMVRFESEFKIGIPDFIDCEGLEYFDQAYKRGKGVFGVTAHLGNFELLAVFFSKMGYKIGVISRPLADNKLNDFLVKNREKMGITNFYASENPIGVVRWLKSGGAVGVLLDTDSKRAKGEFIPVFQRMAKVPVGQSIIAQRLGAAMIPMACIRTSKNRYKVIIKPEIPIIDSRDPRKDIYRITELTTRNLEDLIREYPEQWIWMHNRWKTPPEQKSA